MIPSKRYCNNCGLHFEISNELIHEYYDKKAYDRYCSFCDKNKINPKTEHKFTLSRVPLNISCSEKCAATYYKKIMKAVDKLCKNKKIPAKKIKDCKEKKIFIKSIRNDKITDEQYDKFLKERDDKNER